MDQLDLTPEDFQQIIRIGRRLLVNEYTHPEDLRVALLERLGVGRSALARRIQRLDDKQMAALARSMIVQQFFAAKAAVSRN